MKQKLFFLVFIIGCLQLKAAEFTVGGIKYKYANEESTSAVVTAHKDLYSGDIVIPEKVVYNGKEYIINGIDNSAFSGCTNLTSVSIPNSVNNIGEAAFGLCRLLSSIIIPNSVIKIGNSAFTGSGIESIVLSENLIDIGQATFSSCTNLTSITIPEGVKTIGDYAFSSNRKLHTIILPNTLTTIGNYTFSHCPSIQKLILPESLKTIKWAAFMDCNELTSITIPENVTKIGSEAFSGCTNLSSINLPQNITSLGSYAFKNCKSLRKVEVFHQEPLSITSEFNGIDYDNCHLYVPSGTLSLYKEAYGWSNFTNIIEQATSIDTINKNNGLHVHTNSNKLIIQNIEIGETIKIYDTTARLIHQFTGTENSHEIMLPEKQIYIIKTTHKTIKIAL